MLTWARRTTPNTTGPLNSATAAETKKSAMLGAQNQSSLYKIMQQISKIEQSKQSEDSSPQYVTVCAN
jgi:N-acetylneuraminic acid mutarotase